MYHHPHYPPPDPSNGPELIGTGSLQGRRDRNDLCGNIWTVEIYRGSTLGERHRSLVELVAEKLQHKREADPAGLACSGWLPVLAGSPSVDPAFHVLLTHQMRKQIPCVLLVLRATISHLMRMFRSTALGNFSPNDVLASAIPSNPLR